MPQKFFLIITFLIIALFLVASFFLLNYFQEKEKEEKEIAFYKSLAKNHPRGEEFVKEILEYRKFLKDKNPDNDLKAYLAIGINLNLLGQKEKALEFYERALAIDPKNILALNNIAEIYNDLGQYKKAEYYWLKLINFYPEKTIFYRRLGYLYRYRLRKTSEEIEEFFRKGLEKTDNHPDLLNWLISYYQEIGNNKKFVEYANLLIEKSKGKK
jgi:tetratricopeptide (TPR) repeat protein